MMTARGAALAMVAGSAMAASAFTVTTLARRAISALATLGMRRRRTLGSLGLIDAIERNLAALINLEHTDLDLVAHVENILNLIDAALGDTRDVKQAVFAR